MSYNIDTWKTKTLKNLVIPVEAARQIKYAKVEMVGPCAVQVIGISECFEMNGTLSDGKIEVLKIENYGEASGHSWEDFKQMLAKSTGELVAVQIWEGGDSITRLTVKDGVVTQEQVEL